MPIRQAIIPAGGLGSRFGPTTKAVPKELLPLYDKPLIQYIIDEGIASGIDHFIIVTAPRKEALRRYLESQRESDYPMGTWNSKESQDDAQHWRIRGRFSYIEQSEPLGLGHAILTARRLLQDEPFAIMLPDDVIQDIQPTLRQMIDVYEDYREGVIAVEMVSPTMFDSYGIIEPEPISDRLYRVLSLLEKPSRDKAPSNLAITGRYILPPHIFECLEKTKPDNNNEIQLTDGLSILMETHQLFGYRFPGKRYDGGTPLGLLKGSLSIALEDMDTKKAVMEILQQYL